jgi:hypothetical protein
MLLSRRSLLRGLVAAPAVVAIGSIMPVRAPALVYPKKVLVRAGTHSITEFAAALKQAGEWSRTNEILFYQKDDWA